MKYQLNKAAEAAAAAISQEDMTAINAQAKVPLTQEDVYVFRCEACDDQVDRDCERFTLNALHGMAKLFVGKTVISDHRWSAGNQMARIFRGQVEKDPQDASRNALVLHCYMLRNDSTKDTIAAIEGGILREVSVGCAMGSCRCSICGSDAHTCEHIKGGTYGGELCVYELDDPLDAYELSFVAVPSQSLAGVTKQIHKSGWTPAEMAAAKAQLHIENERMKFINEK